VQNKRKKWKKYIYCKSPQNKELYDEAKEDSSLELKVGMVSFSCSFVKTFWKNAFRSSALHLFSVCISPLSSMIQRDPSHSAEQKKEMEKVYILQEPAK
jgi:hypothetical protein